MLKKILSLLLALTFLLSMMTVGASATEIATDAEDMLEITTSSLTVQPRYIPCPVSPTGKHDMQGRGRGYVMMQNASGVWEDVLYGFASQCTYCYETIISEYNPHWAMTTMLGRYGEWYPGYAIYTGTVTMRVSQLYYNDNLNNEEFRAYIWS